jgi:hypothetical protein
VDALSFSEMFPLLLIIVTVASVTQTDTQELDRFVIVGVGRKCLPEPRKAQDRGTLGMATEC